GVARTLTSDELSAYVNPFRPLDRRGIAAFYPYEITAASDYFGELEAALPRVADKRVLIFWALRDRGFPRGDLERWETTFPNHRTVELPNVDHFFFEDTASQLVAEIEAFVPAQSSSEAATHACVSKGALGP